MSETWIAVRRDVGGLVLPWLWEPVWPGGTEASVRRSLDEQLKGQAPEEAARYSVVLVNVSEREFEELPEWDQAYLRPDEVRRG